MWDNTKPFYFQNPRDSESTIDEDIVAFDTSLEDLVEFYSTSQSVNGDQDPHTVFETLESLLVKPLPKQTLKSAI